MVMSTDFSKAKAGMNIWPGRDNLILIDRVTIDRIDYHWLRAPQHHDYIGQNIWLRVVRDYGWRLLIDPIDNLIDAVLP